MATIITRDILESHLRCKYKSHLKLTGLHGSKSDYEELLDTSRLELRQKTISRILALHSEDEVATSVSLTASTLRSGPSFVLNGILDDELLSLVFDGLKRVDGPSKLGEFHYIPILFAEGRQIFKEHRLLMDLYGVFLSQLQSVPTESGIIWHGKDCRPTKVRLSADPTKAKSLLEEVRHLQSSLSPPRLTLNDHCHVCEFRQRCLDQAVREDNISLLRGMREKEVRRYARKGIFTVTQLAHMFRPVRRGKRAQQKGYKHHYALQALAIRDNRVYVYGTPQLPKSPVHVYIDAEGCPEDKLDYLIGMIIVADGLEQRYSFWADDIGQEQEIFERFLAVLARYDDFSVFCDGGYERTFLRRMRRLTKKKTEVDRVLDSLVNTLTLVYTHFYFQTYSNGLKDVGKCLCCSWTDRGASGVQSIAWRMRWQATHERRIVSQQNEPPVVGQL
jgi:predicted RecB family nuclease